MKYTKRELYLMIIFVLLLFSFIFYKLVLTKQFDEINNLKTKNDNLNVQVSNIKSEIRSRDKLTSNLKVLKANAEDKSDRFFPSISQEKIILLIDKMINDSGIKVDSISFSDIKSGPIAQDDDTSKSSNSNSTQSKTNDSLNDLINEYNGGNVSSKTGRNNTVNRAKTTSANTNVDNMEIVIHFDSDYPNVLSFIKNIENYKKKIIIKNINFNAEDGNKMSGSIALDLYAIPKLNSEDENYLAWNLNDNNGKDNPFFSTASGTSQKSSDAVQNQFDFFINVKPLSFDTPTITIGKSNDDSRSSYIYADNSGVEDIDISLIKQDDNYYYKYKTSKSSYPQQYASDSIKFTPSGKTITINVYSVKRNGSDDNSGADIKIINKTDEMVNVQISGDDTERPRVNISGEGNISVKKQ